MSDLAEVEEERQRKGFQLDGLGHVVVPLLRPGLGAGGGLLLIVSATGGGGGGGPGPGPGRGRGRRQQPGQGERPGGAVGEARPRVA